MNDTPLAHTDARLDSTRDPAIGNLEHAGDFEQEYRAATGAVAVADLSPRGRVEVTGADRVKLIQNLCTNDVAKLALGAGQEVFFLDARGRIVDFATLFALESVLWLDVEPGRAPPLIRHLDRYIIREDVKLADRAEPLAQYHVCGPNSPAHVAGHLGISTANEGLWVKVVTFTGKECQVRRRDRSLHPGFDLLCPAASAAEIWNTLAAPSSAGPAVPIGRAVLEVLRIEAGFPIYGRDFSDENFPQEIGRDAQAISFKKGCYIGQETVARIDSYGHVNKRLWGVRVAEPVALVGHEPVMVGGKRVGAISSFAYSPCLGSTIGLAMLRAGSIEPGTPVVIETTAGPKDATVSALPFASTP